MPAPRPRRISDIMPKIQKVAQTSQVLVKFVLRRSSLRRHMRKKGINDRFISDNIGLLCSDAVLPGSALASLNTAGDSQGLIENSMYHYQDQPDYLLLYTPSNVLKILKICIHCQHKIQS